MGQERHRIVPCDRALDHAETDLLARLVAELPGSQREIAEAQILHLRVIGECEDGCRSLILGVPDSTSVPRFQTDGKLPVDGWITAPDGVTTSVEILIFVREGLLYELEIYRPDGGEVANVPAADSVEVLTGPE
jgi:hypothetical protein